VGLKPINRICPHCGNGNYMRIIEGKNVGKLNVKCINCNSYFNYDELIQEGGKNQMGLKPCPFRVHGERKSSCTIPGEYYYNETFMPCLKRECPCYHEDTGDALCDRNGVYMKLNRRTNS